MQLTAVFLAAERAFHPDGLRGCLRFVPSLTHGLPMVPTEFAAPRWLQSPHVQTLGAAVPWFARPSAHAGPREEELRIPIDDEQRLHARAWWSSTAAEPPRPLVLLVHGIGGSSLSNYVVRAAIAFFRRGYHAVRLDLRGAGASIPDVRTLYHAGLSSDLDRVLSFLSNDPRVSGIYLLGFSGGGSLALKLAGEWGANVPSFVRAFASVSAPLDYTAVGRWMDGAGRLPYRFHVLRGLSRGARAFAAHHRARAHYRPEDVKRLSSFRYYDGTVIVPMHGFASVDAYHEAASSGPYLDRIHVPTLLMHAEDDPMVPFGSVRPWLAKASSSVRVEISRHGGHIGWIGGLDEASFVTNHPVRRTLSFFDATLSAPLAPSQSAQPARAGGPSDVGSSGTAS